MSSIKNNIIFLLIKRILIAFEVLCLVASVVLLKLKISQYARIDDKNFDQQVSSMSSFL
jgi:hypothetical protein